MRVRYDRRHARLRVSLSCAGGGPACASVLLAGSGKRLVAQAAVLVMPAGSTLTRSVKLDSRARRALKRSSKVRFVVSTFSRGGKVSKRTITVKKHKAKKHTAKK